MGRGPLVPTGVPMRHLIRSRFLDLLWDAADLDVLAEFWLRLYELADRTSRFRAQPYHALEIRLRGFARCRTEGVEAELSRRLVTPTFPEPAVYRPDPDTLAFSSGFAAFTEQPAHGLGLPLLRGEPFDGLLAEVRFTVAGFRGTPEGKARVEGTLVVVGEFRGGRLLVKAVWRTGPTGWDDDPHWGTRWQDEAALLGALSKFRVTGTVPDDLAARSFTSRGFDRVAQFAVALTSVPLRGPRLGGLLLRLLLFAGAFAAGALLAGTALLTGLWFLLLVPLLWVLVFAWLFWGFATTELRLLFAVRASAYRAYSHLYSQHIRIVPLLPEEAAPRLDNPWARKYTGELLALGCTPAGVFQFEPELYPGTSLSLFLAPDGVTHVILLIMTSTADLHLWPAAANLLAETSFLDGARLGSVNSDDGYRRKLTGPESQSRVFPNVSDPAEFLDRHAEAVRRFAAETGREPARHGSVEDFIRRHEELQEESRQLYKDAPYTWSDHLHWYLRRIRPAYRE
jgi:hypothetical protein